MFTGRSSRIAVALSFAAALLLSCSAAYAQEKEREDIKQAIEKGVKWLKGQQAADGSWDYNDAPFKLGIHMTEGSTCLALFALLKAGVNPNEGCITKGFAYVRGKPFQHVYTVSCLILALEALYTWKKPEPVKAGKEEEAKPDVDKYITKLAEEKKKDNPARDFQKRANDADKKLMIDAVKWLVEKQEANIWRYPGGTGGNEDCSNTQYAMLALAAARRLQIPVKVDVFKKVAEYFVKNQEEKGPEVEWFPVPGADRSFGELKKIDKEMKEEIRKLDRDYKRQVRRGEQPPAKGWTTTVVEEAQRKMFGEEKKKIHARGWCYMFNDTENMAWRTRITGSMTTSGVASLLIAKKELEENRAVGKTEMEKINTAIRDGCGWLSHKWTTSTNPTGDGGGTIHKCYYLYGLERVGILGLVPRFGKHYWYEEGVKEWLSSQNSDGSWDAGGRGTSGPVPDTCWGILFLRRATTPLVRVPETIYTGEGLFGGKKPGK